MPFHSKLQTDINATDLVLVIGVFDLLHRGHIEFLKKASKLGDFLLVVVNSDRIVSQYKRKTIFSEGDRLEIIKSLRIVDKAILTDELDINPILDEYKPSFIVHGDDWEQSSYLKQIRVSKKKLSDSNIKMKFVPYYNSESTSKIIARVQGLV